MDKTVINKLATHLVGIIHPNADIREAGEEFLEKLKLHEDFAYFLFRLVIDGRFSDTTRQIASVILKNVIKCNWVRLYLYIYSKCLLHYTVCIIKIYIKCLGQNVFTEPQFDQVIHIQTYFVFTCCRPKAND